MTDPIYRHLADANAADELHIILTGEYDSGPLIDTSPTNVTIRPHYTRRQRIWAFIRRRKLLTAVQIPNAHVGPLRFNEDGTATVEFKTQDS